MRAWRKKTEVACADLRAFLGDIEVFDRAEMVRKGRHVKHGLVEVEKADGGFLDDRFRAVVECRSSSADQSRVKNGRSDTSRKTSREMQSIWLKPFP